MTSMVTFVLEMILMWLLRYPGTKELLPVLPSQPFDYSHTMISKASTKPDDKNWPEFQAINNIRKLILISAGAALKSTTDLCKSINNRQSIRLNKPFSCNLGVIINISVFKIN